MGSMTLPASNQEKPVQAHALELAMTTLVGQYRVSIPLSEGTGALKETIQT